MQKFPILPIVFLACIGATFFFNETPKTYPQTIIERVDTPGGPIIVFERDGLTYMTFNEENWNFVESAYNPNDREALPVEYTQLLTASLMYAPAHERILMIGMGGGMVTNYLSRHLKTSDITAVEIDPYVVDIAKKHFGFTENERYRAVIMDGADFLTRQNTPYDIIILDAFSDNVIPPHLKTAEFYRDVAAHLTPGGAVAQNVETVKTQPKEVIAAMSEVFDHIDIYAVRSNFVIIGYRGEQLDPGALALRAEGLQKTYGLRYPPAAFLSSRKAIK